MAGVTPEAAAPLQLFPALDVATEAALRASIERFGVLVPVVYDQHGNLLDGHHRVRLAAEMESEGRLMASWDDVQAARRSHRRRLLSARRAGNRAATSLGSPGPALYRSVEARCRDEVERARQLEARGTDHYAAVRSIDLEDAA